jgi:hypothetical protein
MDATTRVFGGSYFPGYGVDQKCQPTRGWAFQPSSMLLMTSALVDVSTILRRQIAVAQHGGDVGRLVVVGGSVHICIVAPRLGERS